MATTVSYPFSEFNNNSSNSNSNNIPSTLWNQQSLALTYPISSDMSMDFPDDLPLLDGLRIDDYAYPTEIVLPQEQQSTTCTHTHTHTETHAHNEPQFEDEDMQQFFSELMADETETPQVAYDYSHDRDQCSICFDASPNAPSNFFACGHGSLLCAGCCGKLAVCPFCRAPATNPPAEPIMIDDDTDQPVCCAADVENEIPLHLSPLQDVTALSYPTIPSPPDCSQVHSEDSNKDSEKEEEIDEGIQENDDEDTSTAAPVSTPTTTRKARTPSKSKSKSKQKKTKSYGNSRRDCRGPRHHLLDDTLLQIFSPSDLVLDAPAWRELMTKTALNHEQRARLKELRRRALSREYSARYRLKTLDGAPSRSKNRASSGSSVKKISGREAGKFR
eukprot:m.180327 g.180327  ORF g.180327 m.180327 type:complete len:389 (+) comp15497_c1_seq1:411-1577(+)